MSEKQIQSREESEWREWRFADLLEILRLYAGTFCRLAAHLEAVGMQITVSKDDPRDAKTTKKIISTLIPLLVTMQKECERIGLEASVDVISVTLERWRDYHNLQLLMTQCPQIIIALECELKRKVCFILPRLRAGAKIGHSAPRERCSAAE